MAELKPCPFCGGEVEETGGSCNFGKKIMTLNVKCRKCGTSVALKTAWRTNAYLEAVEACHYSHDCENKVLTNADRIREMSDEELKEFICSILQCEFCKFAGWNGCELLEWLQQPAEEGKHD